MLPHEYLLPLHTHLRLRPPHVPFPPLPPSVHCSLTSLPPDIPFTPPAARPLPAAPSLASLPPDIPAPTALAHRYADNYFPVNNFSVLANPTDKSKISDFGPPEKFLESVGYLLGRQAYSGERPMHPPPRLLW